MECFFTQAYKSGWIHTHYDRALRQEVVKAQFKDGSVRHMRSLHAAKCAITRAGGAA